LAFRALSEQRGNVGFVLRVVVLVAIAGLWTGIVADWIIGWSSYVMIGGVVGIFSLAIGIRDDRDLEPVFSWFMMLLAACFLFALVWPALPLVAYERWRLKRHRAGISVATGNAISADAKPRASSGAADRPGS
jgi:hypothetical protein